MFSGDYIVTYEIIDFGRAGQAIKRTDDTGIEAWIPIDPANIDYQAYLEWKAQQS